ncbi:plasmid mobilization protein [uncultured Mobiluncus sp.]|uniref:plasmid mobilization protein n=1 Tax=uncultured Mobiluncus sp. TaxID=293425 RepID=UPI00288A6076|nr:plasmid mobilization relaxosome protein MobC [uncultured Mobiluncus sp.]
MKKDKKHAGKIPASSERKRKSGTVKIRVTESEAAAIKSKANQWGVTVSQYLRDAALNHEVHKMIITNNSDLNLLTAEVNKVGINLNQIARRLNASESYRKCFGVSPMREAEVLSELKDLQTKFASIDRQLLDAREEFSREQTDKIFDYEDYMRAKDFWFPNDGGETDGDDIHPSA